MPTRKWLVLIALFGLLTLGVACGGDDDSDDDPTRESTRKSRTTPSPEATEAKDLTPQQIVEKLQYSVININTTSPEGSGGGSGFVWEDGKHVLTNAHVVIGAASIKVVDPKDKKELSAKVVAMSPCDDVALLEIERANFQPAPIGDSNNLQPGEEVVALGYPSTAGDWQGQKLTVTRGIVSKLHDKWNGREDLIQTDAAINPGNSGGPLVNMRGEVVGMNTLTQTNKQAVNWAISMDEAKFIADKLKGGKNINYLGLKLMENYRGLAQELGIALAYIDGIVVLGVDQGSPAHKAGIGYSDLIYTIDHTAVASVGELCDILRSKKPGQQIRVDFTRTYTDGSYKDFYSEVTLE